MAIMASFVARRLAERTMHMQASSRNTYRLFQGFRFGGHRGSPVNSPENTIASMEQAMLEGADLIEFDVELTKDLIPVIIHDDTLDRTTNMKGPVSQYFYRDLLLSCDCADKFIPPDGKPVLPAQISTLDEMIRWAKANNMKMILDIKHYEVTLMHKLEELFDEFDIYDSAIICSFHPLVIYKIKQLNSLIPTGMTWRRWNISYQDLEWNIRRYHSTLGHYIAILCDMVMFASIKLWLPNFLGVDMILTERGEISENYVKYMTDRGFRVCAWTVNDPNEMAWMHKTLGIPFLTDNPALAKTAGIF